MRTIMNGTQLLVLMLLTVLPLPGCSSEYVCPDPIGRIVRDECDAYKTRYESLKVELSFSIGNLGVSAAAGKEKLRDPSELLQLLMQQTLALCKDFNTCRVPSADYQRRREEADRKFTAITAISQQLKGDLDADSKRPLVAKLMEVITGEGQMPGRSGVTRPPRREYCKYAFQRTTDLYFDARFQPPQPTLPPGVPAVVGWDMGHSRPLGRSEEETYLHLSLWGTAELDDWVHVKLPGQREARSRVSRGQPEASAQVHFEERLEPSGTMTVDYTPGATGKRHSLGTFPLGPQTWLPLGFLAYMPNPVGTCPVEYERPYLIFFSRVPSSVRVTMRCTQDGKPVPGVLEGLRHIPSASATRVSRFHLPLPVRIPLKGGTTRGAWTMRPGEVQVRDRFPKEAAGEWVCRASFNGRVGRKLTFRLRPDGSVQRYGRVGVHATPWWPVATERVDNDVERRSEAEIAEEERQRLAKIAEAADRKRREEEERNRPPTPGQLSPGVVAATLQPELDWLKRCARGPGAYRFKIHIHRVGEVLRVDLVGRRDKTRELIHCFARIIRRVHFPKTTQSTPNAAFVLHVP